MVGRSGSNHRHIIAEITGAKKNGQTMHAVDGSNTLARENAFPLIGVVYSLTRRLLMSDPVFLFVAVQKKIEMSFNKR
jgi:hypothetical protein